MKKILRGSLIAGLAVLGTMAPMQAQDRAVDEQENNIPYGTRSGEFLLLPVGARATALGSAYAPLASDVSALYWNPAGLSLMENKGAMVSHIDYVADTRYTWAGVAFPFSGGERTLGLQVGVFGFDEQPVTTVLEPDGTGSTYSVSMSVIGLTYAQRFNDRFSFGLTGKVVNEDLANASASTLTADIGTLYQTEIGGRTIRGAFVIQNLGGALEHEGSPLDVTLPGTDPNLPPSSKDATFQSKEWELPATFRVGVAYDVMSTANSRLTTVGEFRQPTGNDVSGGLGAEYALERIGDSGFSFALRGGWNLEPDNGLDLEGSDLNGMNMDGLSLGGGLGYAISDESDVGFDYAFRNMGLLGEQHLFSFGVTF